MDEASNSASAGVRPLREGGEGIKGSSQNDRARSERGGQSGVPSLIQDSRTGGRVQIKVTLLLGTGHLWPGPTF